MLKVLGLAGSPRRSGNTSLLLDQALAGVRSIGAAAELIVLADQDISPCQHCDGCLGSGVCVIGDDMQPLHRKLLECDRLVLACPIFFMGPAAQAKATIDRCQALWVLKYLLKKRHQLASDGSKRRGLFISVGGMKRPDLFNGARLTVKAFFASCDVEYGEELLYPGVDLYQEISRHPAALQEAYQAGARLVTPA